MSGVPIAAHGGPISTTDTPSAATGSDLARPRQFTLVQALRGIAALWVVLFHASAGRHIAGLTDALPPVVRSVVFDHGELGVAIFFALSGFVIAHSLSGVTMNWGRLGRFALRRSIRLDPPYWAAIAFCVVMALVSATVRREPLVVPGFLQVVAHILYLQEILRLPEINTVFWTLTYEIQFYLFFALCMVLVDRPGEDRSRTPAWIAMFLIAVIATTGAFDGLVPGLFLPLWNSFLVGALASVAAARPAARPFLALLVVMMVVRSGIQGSWFGGVSAITAALLAVSVWRGYADTGLNWRALQFLGTISYSLYLTHNPVTGAVGFLMRRIGFGDGVAGGGLTMAVILAVVIAFSALFWAVFERPSHALSRRVSLRGAA